MPDAITHAIARHEAALGRAMTPSECAVIVEQTETIERKRIWHERWMEERYLDMTVRPIRRIR